MQTRADHGFTLAGDAPISSWFRRNIPLLSSVIHGLDAQKALADLPDASGRVGLVMMPAFLWISADPTAVGRKAGYRPGGPTNRLPMRVNWQPGTITLLTDTHDSSTPGGHTITTCDETGTAHTPLAWTSVGPGYSGHGTVTPRFDGQDWHRAPSGTTAHTEVAALGRHLPVSAQTHEAIEATLTELIDRGRLAYWDLLAELEELLRAALERSRVAISSEITDALDLPYQHVVSDTTLESILNETTYGAQDNNGRSRVMKLLDRCCQPEKFQKVDPQRYIIVSLREQADSSIRKKLGDPHIGPKIRRIVNENPELRTISDILDTYRRTYPADQLGVDRLAAAFSFAPDPTAALMGLHFDSGEERRLPGDRTVHA